MRLVRMWHAVLIQLGFCLAVVSCAKSPSTEGPRGNEEVVTVYKAPEGRFDRTVREVVRDSATWRTLWDSLSGFGDSPAQPPVVNFQTAMLIVVAGPVLGAGDSVIITNVHRKGSGFQASIMTYMQCSPLDISTVPVHVVQVPRVDGSVRFEEDTTSTSVCPPSP
jgi:hypothetical protein